MFYGVDLNLKFNSLKINKLQLNSKNNERFIWK